MNRDRKKTEVGCSCNALDKKKRSHVWKRIRAIETATKENRKIFFFSEFSLLISEF